MQEYIYFTFDGISSSKYNLVVQNTGEDLIYPSQPGFENQIIAPIYQGATYLAGVNKKERVFNFNCWVDSLALDVLREMLTWLSVNKVGTLSLGYNPNFQYQVKINSIADFKHMAINGEDGTVNYEFQISFVTIGSPASESVITYKVTERNLLPIVKAGTEEITNLITGPNYDNGGPIGFIENNKFKFLNYYSESIPINLNIKTYQGFEVVLNNKTYYKYSLPSLTTKAAGSTISGNIATLYFSNIQSSIPFSIGMTITVSNVIASGATPSNCYQVLSGVVTACTTSYVKYLLDITPTGSYSITTNGTITKTLTTINVNSEYGFCRINNALAESIAGIKTDTNIGLMKIPSGESQIKIGNLIYWNLDTGIIQIDNNDGIISYLRNEISNGNLYVIIQDGSYGDESTPGIPDYDSIIK